MATISVLAVSTAKADCLLNVQDNYGRSNMTSTISQVAYGPAISDAQCRAEALFAAKLVCIKVLSYSESNSTIKTQWRNRGGVLNTREDVCHNLVPKFYLSLGYTMPSDEPNRGGGRPDGDRGE